MKLNSGNRVLCLTTVWEAWGKSCAGDKQALESAWQKYPSLLLASALLSQPHPHQKTQKDACAKAMAALGA